MGIYDRDYYRPETPDRHYNFLKPESMVATLIIANLLVFLASNFITPEVNDVLMLRADTIFYPWFWWKFLSYGFVHANFYHILGNMLTFFFLAPLVEKKYGQHEFLLFYLVTIVVGGVVWSLLNLNPVLEHWEFLVENPSHVPALLGASGGVAGVVILLALNFPRISVFLYGVIEMPMWVLGIMYVTMDAFGAFGGMGASNVAFTVHLTGAAFAAIYFFSGLRFTAIPYQLLSWTQPGQKRRYKVYSDSDAEKEERQKMEIDRILKKISEQGQAKLSWSERRTLKKASRDFQKKNRP